MVIYKTLTFIGMAHLKRSGKPTYTDSMYFPVVGVSDESVHRFYPIKTNDITTGDNGISGYVADDEIKDFYENYKIKPIKDANKEFEEFFLL